MASYEDTAEEAAPHKIRSPTLTQSRVSTFFEEQFFITQYNVFAASYYIQFVNCVLLFFLFGGQPKNCAVPYDSICFCCHREETVIHRIREMVEHFDMMKNLCK